MTELTVEVKKRLDAGETLPSIRASLVSQGHMEHSVDGVIRDVSIQNHSSAHTAGQKNAYKITAKEIFDRLGFGFGSQQYLNIFFYLTGGSLFLIGLINGFKNLFSMFLSSFVHEFSKVSSIKKSTIVWSGIIFAASFLMVGIAAVIQSVVIFAVGLIIGSIFLVLYGDIYYNLVVADIHKERMSHFLRRMSHYGLLITSVALLAGGVILDAGSEKGFTLLMIVTTFFFMLSVLLILFTRVKSMTFGRRKLLFYLSIHFQNIKENLKSFFTNQITLILLITGAATGIIQALGNSYYGIFIYTMLKGEGFGGFLNVAVIFVIALLSSMLGSTITQANSRQYGKFPMLVFGTMLMAIMPFTYYYNPNVIAIGMATLLGVIGGSIAGVARGLLAIDMLHEDLRKRYFSISSFLFIIPYIILIPVGSYIAQAFGMKTLFLLLGLSLVVFVVPLYFVIVLLATKQKSKI